MLSSDSLKVMNATECFVKASLYIKIYNAFADHLKG